MKPGKRANRCPYCGRPCAEKACAQHRDLLDSHYCYREVERIAARGPNGHPRCRVKKLSIAGTRCDRAAGE